MLDILIRGGSLVDGTGATRRRADVGIEEGRVVALGMVDGPARRTIEADGRIVAPGFVDIHTHFDAQAFWDPTLSPSPLHGVTTVMAGNCGFSIAPLRESEAAYMMRMLARVEGMPLNSLKSGVPWDWASTEEFLDRLDGTLAINAGFMVGHSALRRTVMGEAAIERPARSDELAAMAALLDVGLAAGGMGFSSTWAPSHNDAEGIPVPSRHAHPTELLTLAKVCRSHPGTSLEFNVSPGTWVPEERDLMVGMSVCAGRPINWNVMAVTAGNVDDCVKKLTAGDYARSRGGKVVALTIPMPTEFRYTFLTGFLLDALPGWAAVMALPTNEKLRALSDPAVRRRLDDLDRSSAWIQASANWDQRRILETFTAGLERYQGRIVGDIAAEEQKNPFDALLDIVCADQLRTTFAKVEPPDRPAEWEARRRVWSDPRTVLGGSDAGAHLDILGTFSYTTRFLRDAVRDHCLFPLEEAVRLITDVPAQLYGLVDRGRLYEGAIADVVVFDEEHVGPSSLCTRFDLPGGAGRLYAEAKGIDHVLVNGTEIVTAGRFTDERPGTTLRSGADTRTPSLE